MNSFFKKTDFKMKNVSNLFDKLKQIRSKNTNLKNNLELFKRNQPNLQIRNFQSSLLKKQFKIEPKRIYYQINYWKPILFTAGVAILSFSTAAFLSRSKKKNFKKNFFFLNFFFFFHIKK